MSTKNVVIGYNTKLFKERVLKQMKERNLTYKRLADLMHRKSDKHIISVISGGEPLTYDTLNGLCKALEVPSEYLLVGKGVTNFDYIHNADVEMLAEFICNHIERCDDCPGTKNCVYKEGYANGLVKWLRDQVGEEYR